MQSKQHCMSALLLLSLLVSQAYANDCCESAVFVPRSITTDLVYDDVFNYYLRHYNEREKFIYSGTVLYQRSSKSSKMGSAFLLRNGCNCIDVNQQAPGDVNSVWLGLQNTDPANPFASQFCIRPERSVVGYHNYWYVDLSDYICGVWFDIATALLDVRHDLNCCESGNESSVCSDITNVTEALRNSDYKFGKFICGPCDEGLHYIGFDDIQVRLGYERDWCDQRYNAGIYFIATIPTGRKRTAEYVFEPVIGSRHGSVGAGFNADHQFWCDECGDRALTIMTDFNYRYVLSHGECRTFDLCENGPFSRFLLVADEDDPTTPLPAVNFFTQKADITPGSTVQWWLAMNYQHDDYDFEFGYNLFWRQAEDLKDCLSAPCKTVGVYDLTCVGAGCTSASTAKIGTYASDIVSDAAFTAVNANDFDENSGLAGDVLTNKLYAAGAYEGCWCDCMDWLVAVGGSYEFVSDKYECDALPTWAVFGRFSLMF